jgi:hypothetical protein
MEGLIQDLHFLIKLKAQKLDSNSKADLTPAIIDTLINKQSGVFVDIFFSGNPQSYNLGFEMTQHRIDMLSDLLVKQPEQPSLIPQALKDGIYEVKFSSLKYPYRHLVRATTQTECGPVNIALEKHFTLNTILNDEFSKASKAWKRIPFTIGRSSDGNGSSIYLYTDNKLSISSIDIEYIKQPREVFIGGYDSLNFLYTGEGYTKEDSPVNPEISSNYFDILADLVVQEWERSYSLDYNISKDTIISKV